MKKAKYGNKSGTKSTSDYASLHPKPPTKSGDAVEKANNVKKAPGALGR